MGENPRPRGSPPLPPGQKAASSSGGATTWSSRPRRRGSPRSGPRAPLPRPAPHKGPLSRRVPGLWFLKSPRKKPTREAKSASAAERAVGGEGGGPRQDCSRCPLQDPKAEESVGGSPRNRKSPRLHLEVRKVEFLKVEASGARHRSWRQPGRRDRVSRGGRGQVWRPRSSLPTPPGGSSTVRPDKLLPPRRRLHRAWPAPLGETAEASGPSRPPPSTVRCQTQGFSSAARARRDRLPHRLLPVASGMATAQFLRPCRAARPPSPRRTRGPWGRGRCLPTGAWLLGLPFSSPGTRGLLRASAHLPEATVPELGSSSSPHPRAPGLA